MKKIRCYLLAFLLACMSINYSLAQTREFTNLVSYRPSGSGPILENDNIKGYYAFYMYDKADKKNDAYLLQLMDDNLNIVKSMDVLRPRGDLLLETVFNGTCFVSMFYNHKEESLELSSYDKSGKTLGTFKAVDLPKWEKRRLQAVMMNQDDAGNTTVFPLGNTGFARQSYTKNEKLGYVIEGFSNDLKKIWTVSSPETSEMLETADMVYSSETHIVLAVARKKTLMTKNADMFIQVIDAKAGKVLFEKPMKDDNEWSVLNVFIDQPTSQIYFFGEYFPKGAEMLKSKSEGIVTIAFDMSGKELNKKKYSWTNDLNKILKADQSGDVLEIKDNVRPFFHRIYKAPNGHIVAVGEQFGKATSGLGIASRAMGGGGSTVQINIYNMVVLDIAPDLSVSSYNAYLKKKTSVGLPAGYGSVNSTVLAYYVKGIGGFDYEFSTFDQAKGKFACVYRDYDRSKGDGEKADVMLGVIKYEGDKLTGTRVPISINSNSFSINPAKPGFVAISEYYKKKKMLVYRLEKLIY